MRKAIIIGKSIAIIVIFVYNAMCMHVIKKYIAIALGLLLAVVGVAVFVRVQKVDAPEVQSSDIIGINKKISTEGADPVRLKECNEKMKQARFASEIAADKFFLDCLKS